MNDVLYRLTSTVDDYERRHDKMVFDNVRITWQVIGRSVKASQLYDRILQQYLSKVEAATNVPTVNTLRSYFAEEEAAGLERFVGEALGWGVSRSKRRSFNLETEVETQSHSQNPYYSESSVRLSGRDDYHLPFKGIGLVNWNSAVAQAVQRARLYLKIDRKTMIKLTSKVGNAGKEVADLALGGVEAAVKKVIGKLPGKISVDRHSYWGSDFGDAFADDIPWEEEIDG